MQRFFEQVAGHATSIHSHGPDSRPVSRRGRQMDLGERLVRPHQVVAKTEVTRQIGQRFVRTAHGQQGDGPPHQIPGAIRVEGDGRLHRPVQTDRRAPGGQPVMTGSRTAPRTTSAFTTTTRS
ncbi:hypothetical protein SM007_05715 [Streptomyces avermitilis]|nr:hypothetical protein SM007_05715 [Streptomyces avermitilis]